MERALGTVLITGATGFLGGALARDLAGRGERVIGLGRNLKAGELLESRYGVEFRAMDLTNAKLEESFADIDTVFHCAALSSPWGRPIDFEQANVVGTASVVQACQKRRVSRLIHISTPSLYFRHDAGLQIREDHPPADPPVNDYVRTKRRAEEIVDAAAAEGLPTITLRPRAIYGPGDNSILPRLVRAMKSGRLRVIGTGKNVADMTYIDNAVLACRLAAQCGPEFLGRKYNITNDEPLPLWQVIQRLAEALHYSLKPGRIPTWLARSLAGALEMTHRIFCRSQEPVLTRYSVGVLTASQTLDIGAAKRDLGYAPRITTLEGVKRYAEHLQADCP